jgi:hypothetical protein
MDRSKMTLEERVSWLERLLDGFDIPDNQIVKAHSRKLIELDAVITFIAKALGRKRTKR